MSRSVAVDKLLLRKVEESTIGSSPVRVLSTSGSRESPTRPTSSLVLNGVDATLILPINGDIVLTLIEDCGLNFHILRNGTQPFIRLFLSHGREHVVFKLEGVLRIIHLINLSILFLEEIESELVLLNSSERKALSLHVIGKLLPKLTMSLRREEILKTKN